MTTIPRNYEECCYLFTIGQECKRELVSVVTRKERGYPKLTSYSYSGLVIATRTADTVSIIPQMGAHRLAIAQHQNEILALVGLPERVQYNTHKRCLEVVKGLATYPLETGIVHTFYLQ
jgi:hypothetical protein